MRSAYYADSSLHLSHALMSGETQITLSNPPKHAPPSTDTDFSVDRGERSPVLTIHGIPGCAVVHGRWDESIVEVEARSVSSGRLSRCRVAVRSIVDAKR